MNNHSEMAARNIEQALQLVQQAADVLRAHGSTNPVPNPTAETNVAPRERTLPHFQGDFRTIGLSTSDPNFGRPTSNLPSNQRITFAESVQAALPRHSITPTVPGTEVNATLELGPPNTNPSFQTPRREVLPGNLSVGSCQSVNRDVNAVSEMRRLFSPYTTPTAGPSRRRGSGGQQLRGRPKIQLSFLCLGSPNDLTVPNARRRQILQESGLGKATIAVERDLTSQALELTLRTTFPKLENHGLEVLRPFAGHGAGKPLVQIVRDNLIPTPDILAHQRALIYIRPLQDVVPINATGEGTPEVTRVNVLVAETTERPSFNEIFRSEIASSGLVLRNSDPGAQENSSINPAELTDEAPHGNNLASPRLSSTLITREEGFHYSGDTEGSMASDNIHESDFMTVDDYRVRMFTENPGLQEILISREEFQEGLLGIYKNPSFNFRKKTFVKFIGEPGTDHKALTKEFFALSLKALKQPIFGPHTFFEGEEGFLLPTNDPMLIGSKLYSFLGKFMGHSALQTGVGFIGISQAAIKYIFRDDFAPEPIVLEEKDVPCLTSRMIISKMMKFIDTNECSEDDMGVIKGALTKINVFVTPNLQNIHLLLQQYMEYKVFIVRYQSLEGIKKGLQSSGMYDFLKNRPYLWDAVFPSSKAVTYSCEEVVELINFTACDYSLLLMVKDCVLGFVRNLGNDELVALVHAWTGWPLLPSDPLNVHITEDGEFIFHACFQQLDIPKSFRSSDITLHLRMLLDCGHVGFGSA